MPRVLDTIDGILNTFASRVVLSVLIIASLLPTHMSHQLILAFFLVFGTEVTLRALVLAWRARTKKLRISEVLVLLLDLGATLSFLPIENLPHSVLRAGRIVRLLLLLAYWGPMARDFFRIALQRERLSQIFLVGGLAAVLTGIGAVALRFIDTQGLTITSTPGEQVEFFDLLWWAFRQVEDPGNLVPTTDNAALTILSLVLTGGGLFLVAFLIGIGTGLVEDLVKAGRQRRVGLREHTVILNVSEANQAVLQQINRYFAKQIHWRKVALQGPWPSRPDFLGAGTLRTFHYRGGRPSEKEALQRLDLSEARRIAILSVAGGSAADAEAVATVMNVRQLNAGAWIVVELNHPTNIPAALKAGQNHTIAVPARRLAALVLTQELLDAGRSRLFQDLVTLKGEELYTCIYGDGELAHLGPAVTLDRSFSELRRECLKTYGCLLLGYLRPCEHSGHLWLQGMETVVSPPPDQIPGEISGLIGLASRFSVLREAAVHLARGGKQESGDTVLRSSAPAFDFSRIRSPRLQHVIVLGFHDDTVETVGELLRLFSGLEVTLVGKNEADRQMMRAAFELERFKSGAQFVADGPKRLTLQEENGERTGTVHVRVADRYADGLYRPGDVTGRVGNLFDYDAAILLTEPVRDRDPDGASVLGVLKLLDNWEASQSAAPQRLRRVVVEMEHEDKGQLLAKLVEGLDLQQSISFVMMSRLRHQILTQSFFVPGLPALLHNLLTAGREEVIALEPRDNEGEFVFMELMSTLERQEHPMLPLALLTRDDELIVNPADRWEGRWADIRRIYCIVSS
jgi:hypothetical protein